MQRRCARPLRIPWRSRQTASPNPGPPGGCRLARQTHLWEALVPGMQVGLRWPALKLQSFCHLLIYSLGDKSPP